MVILGVSGRVGGMDRVPEADRATEEEQAAEADRAGVNRPCKLTAVER